MPISNLSQSALDVSFLLPLCAFWPLLNDALNTNHSLQLLKLIFVVWRA